MPVDTKEKIMKEILGISVTDEYFDECFVKQSQGGTIQIIDGAVYCLLGTEEVQNGVIVDISNTDEYKAKITENEKTSKKAELQTQMNALDLKCIRALREGGIKDETTGQTWLEYYNNQILELRAAIKDCS